MILVVMGVSGSGKTTIAKALSTRLGWEFADGDDFHTAAAREKMHAGTPLTDADRTPWLASIAAWITARASAGKDGIIACSALKRSYRDILTRAFSSQVDTGSREENATEQRLRAFSRFGERRKRSSAVAATDVQIVYLRGDRDLLARRLRARSGHFMPQALLGSQIETLEEPGIDESPIIVDIDEPVATIVEAIIAQLHLTRP